MHNARPDLNMTGRTLFGHAPAKGQQLEDHYFGRSRASIKLYACAIWEAEMFNVWHSS